MASTPHPQPLHPCATGGDFTHVGHQGSPVRRAERTAVHCVATAGGGEAQVGSDPTDGRHEAWHGKPMFDGKKGFT